MRTTFIVGFPGETEAEFQELVGFVQSACFKRTGVFTYSFEPGTPATKLDGHLPEEIKQERRARLMGAQQEVHLRYNHAQIGKTVEVIVDGPDPEMPNHVHARARQCAGNRLPDSRQGEESAAGRSGISEDYVER